MIELQNIMKAYKNGENNNLVLDNINLTFEEGSITAIMGRSGCGKTTLLNIIGTYIRPTSGSLFLNQKEIDFHSHKKIMEIRRKYIGYIVQSFALIDKRTVWENLQIPICGIGNHQTRKEMTDYLLYEVGLEEKKHKYPFQLSNGEKQRVAIARALLGDKKIILADEPTGSLDGENANRIMDLLIGYVKENNITAIIVTHDNEIAKKCEKIINISYGTILKGRKI